MHVTNVHVTRAHIDGKIKSVERTGGKHHPIYFFKKNVGATSQAIKKNARVTMVVEDMAGKEFTINWCVASSPEEPNLMLQKAPK